MKTALLSSMPSGFRERCAQIPPKKAKKVKSEEVEPVISANGIVVTHADVLLGRGKGSYEWRGNVRYQQIIGLYLPMYMQAKKKMEKTQISINIVDHVKQSGGRFLKEKIRGNLCEVPDKEARDKVAQALRFRRKAFEKTHGLAESNLPFSIGRFSSSSSPTAEPCSSTALLFAKYRNDKLSNSSTRTEDTEPILSSRSNCTYSDETLSRQQKRRMDEDWFEQSESAEDSMDMVAENMRLQFGSTDFLAEADCGSDISSEFSSEFSGLEIGSDDGLNH